MAILIKLILSVMFLGIVGCGVKGRPLPPLNPAPLGRGEPTFKETPKKNPNKTRPHVLDETPSVEAEEL